MAKAQGKEVELSAKNNWTHTFSNLPLKARGKRFQYQVKEVGTIKGYTSTVDDSNKGKYSDHNILTQSNRVSGQEIWTSVDNKDEKVLSGKKITVRLLADGQSSCKEITADNWQASFTDLPMYTRKVRRLPTRFGDPVAGYTKPLLVVSR